MSRSPAAWRPRSARRAKRNQKRRNQTEPCNRAWDTATTPMQAARGIANLERHERRERDEVDGRPELERDAHRGPPRLAHVAPDKRGRPQRERAGEHRIDRVVPAATIHPQPWGGGTGGCLVNSAFMERGVLSAANHPNRRRGAGSREFSTHGTGRASRVVGRRWVCVVDAGPRRRAVRDRRTGRSRGGVGVRSADWVGRERHARVAERAAGEKRGVRRPRRGREREEHGRRAHGAHARGGDGRGRRRTRSTSGPGRSQSSARPPTMRLRTRAACRRTLGQPERARAVAVPLFLVVRR